MNDRDAMTEVKEVSTEEAIALATSVAPAHRTLVQVSEYVNQELGLDWSAAKWRGIWKSNPAAKFTIQKRLGESFNRHTHGQKLHIPGNVRGVVVNDTHAPFHDPCAIALAAKVIKWWKPDVLVHNGDGCDFSGLSKFDQNPARKFRAQDDVDQWQTEVAIPLNTAAGARCRKIVLPGNHDLRMLKFLWQHPELFSVRALHLPALWEVEKLGMEYVGYAVVIDGLLEISHGTKVSVHAGYAAKAELTKRGYSISTATGHNHRGGRHELQTPYGGLIIGQEIPCLCDRNPDYSVDPNWVQGLGLFETRNHSLHIEAVKFTDDYRCQVGGKWFGLD